MNEWLSVDDVAKHLRVSKKFVYDSIKAGQLRHIRLAGRRSIRIRADWLTAWTERDA